jgi:hypothetical protein
MSEYSLDRVEQYRAYLERFEATAGPGEFGQFLKHNGRLIKKLRYDEFEPKFVEYCDMTNAYTESLSRGDTINDLVVRILRERADELMLPRPD